MAEDKPQTEARAAWDVGERLHGAQSVASEGVHLIRDVASDTVRAAGDVGIVAIGATRDLLVGVADGMRDVIAHIVPARFGGHAGPQAGGPEARH